MKKIMLLLLLIFFVNSAYSQQTIFQETTMKDMFTELAIKYKENVALNKTNIDIEIKTDDGLKIIFTDTQTINESGFSESGNIFGVFIPNKKTIMINAETINDDIQNQNLSDEDFILKLQNTFIHELTHYIDYYGIIDFEDFEQQYNINIDVVFEQRRVANHILYTNNYSKSFYLDELPDVIRQSINFTWIFNQYPLAQWRDEIISRYTAVCLYEDETKPYYSRMEYSNYSICNEFEFIDEFDNKLSNEVKYVIFAYIEDYKGIDLVIIETTEQLPQVGDNIGLFVLDVVYAGVYLILGLVVAGFVIIFLSSVKNLVIDIVNSILKKK